MRNRDTLTIPEIGHLSELELDEFPPVEGFRVSLRDAGVLGRHVRFEDAEGRALASFPWWDHADIELVSWTLDRVPLGTRAKPFDDCEEGWQLFVFEENGWVYVVEGSEPCCLEFERWFKVKKDEYLAAWRTVLEEVTVAHRTLKR